MGAELAFERLAIALEATRGTAIATPTHVLPLQGQPKPIREKYRPANESTGLLAEFTRARSVRTRAELSASGGLDTTFAPVLFNTLYAPVTTPTTPTGATNARLWTFTPSMTSDNVKSITIWSGDPNVQTFRSAYGMASNFEVSGDASGTDGVTCTYTATALYPSQVASPTYPTFVPGVLLMPSAMQVWIDTTLAIGTSEVAGRVVSASVSTPLNRSYKYYAKGATSDLSFSETGIGKRSATATIAVSFDSAAVANEYAHFVNDTIVKLRVRYNGPLIEGALFHFVEYDIYGTVDDVNWTEIEGTNRGMELTIISQWDSATNADYVVRVQNNRTAL